MSGRHSQGAAVAGPRPAASTAEPARLGPGRGPISMGMIRPAGTPGEWSAEIESVFSAPDPSDPVFPVYFNMTLSNPEFQTNCCASGPSLSSGFVQCSESTAMRVQSGCPFIDQQNIGGHAQGLRTRISRLGTLGKLGLPLLYSQAGEESSAFCSIDRQDHTTSSGTSAP